MGRELKRVALDFDWPLDVVWSGYLNPYSFGDDCAECNGTGRGPEAQRFHDQWYGNAPFNPADTGSTPVTADTPSVRAFAEHNVQKSAEYYGNGEAAIVREARRLAALFNCQWMHHLDQGDVDTLLKNGRLTDLTDRGIEHPTAVQVNEASIHMPLLHDSMSVMYCVEGRCQRIGVDPECPRCHGEGVVWNSQAAKWLYEQWIPVEPPAGEGWQFWETVTEGSPQSPVFPTSEELVQWMIGQGYTEAGARAFVKSGFAFSFVASAAGIQNGIDAQANKE